MRHQLVTILILGLLVMTSCRSIRNLTSKDNSGKTNYSTKTKSTVKREFLTEIEVTPGWADKSIQQKEDAVKSHASLGNIAGANKYTNEGKLNGGIESTKMLQLKYAIATDATLEKLSNIPLLELIDKWWGTKYCIGGNTENCIDCSAFTQIIMRDIYQISLPRTAQEQYLISERIEPEELREGDLVFFNTNGKDISHVGVYLLNNKFVHAATSGGVMISDLNEKYWHTKYRGAGRVINN